MPQGQLARDSSVNPVGNLKTDVNEPTGQHMKRQDNKMVVIAEFRDAAARQSDSESRFLVVVAIGTFTVLEICKALMGY